jgi:hypothetical protein
VVRFELFWRESFHSRRTDIAPASQANSNFYREVQKQAGRPIEPAGLALLPASGASVKASSQVYDLQRRVCVTWKGVKFADDPSHFFESVAARKEKIGTPSKNLLV